MDQNKYNSITGYSRDSIIYIMVGWRLTTKEKFLSVYLLEVEVGSMMR
jgi:hypothetical protein